MGQTVTLISYILYPTEVYAENASDPTDFFSDYVRNNNKGVVSWLLLFIVPLHTMRLVRDIYNGSTGILTPALRSEAFSPWTSVG